MRSAGARKTRAPARCRATGGRGLRGAAWPFACGGFRLAAAEPRRRRGVFASGAQFQEEPMSEMRDPRLSERRDPASRNEFMPMWGWVALVIAVIVVFGLIFTWSGDGTRQQAETKSPPATSSTPPAKSPTTPPPANNPTPPAKSQ
jgi:hypothetical protein